MKMITTFLGLTMLALLAVGCGDDSSPTVVDTAPPAIPDGLSVSFVRGAVTVSWQPNVVDSDFLGFRVVKHYLGQATVLRDNPSPATDIQDQADPGYNEYRVTSVDRAGNESGYATIAVTIPYQHEPATPEEF
jgi:hypothetical protein